MPDELKKFLVYGLSQPTGTTPGLPNVHTPADAPYSPTFTLASDVPWGALTGKPRLDCHQTPTTEEVPHRPAGPTTPNDAPRAPWALRHADPEVLILVQGCWVLTLAFSPAPLVLSLSFPIYKRATLLVFAKCVSVPDASTPRSRPTVPPTSGGGGHKTRIGLGRGHGQQGPSTRPEMAAVPGQETQVSRLWTWGAPQGPAWALCQNRPALASSLTCFSGGLESPNPKGGGREPGSGFSPKSLEEVWVRKCTGPHCKRSQSIPVLRPHGTSRRRAEGHLDRDRMGATGSGTPGAKETTEKPPEQLGSSAQGLRQGATQPPLRATERGDWGSAHRAFGCWCLTQPPGPTAGDACVWKAIPPPPQISAPH